MKDWSNLGENNCEDSSIGGCGGGGPWKANHGGKLGLGLGLKMWCWSSCSLLS